MFLNQNHFFRATLGIVVCVLVVGAGYAAKGQARPKHKWDDPMLEMFQQARDDSDARFQKGYSSLQTGLGYAPLPAQTANGSLWVDAAWETMLNREKVYVAHPPKPLALQAKAQTPVRQAKHRQWTRHFLRSELLPPKTDWPTQFYRAPNGEEVAVTSWRSNGFSIRVCDGKTLCVVVRPDDSRDVFGHTLKQLVAARKSGQTSRSWTDYLPPAYDLNNYAQQIYLLVTPEVLKNKEKSPMTRIQVQPSDAKNRIAQGTTLSINDAVSLEPLDRTFAHEVRYWTDGATVVFVVDKLLAPPTPIKSG